LGKFSKSTQQTYCNDFGGNFVALNMVENTGIYHCYEQISLDMYPSMTYNSNKDDIERRLENHE